MRIQCTLITILTLTAISGCGDSGEPDGDDMGAPGSSSAAPSDDAANDPGDMEDDCVPCDCPDGEIGLVCPEFSDACICDAPEDPTAPPDDEEINCWVEATVSGEVSEQFTNDSCGGFISESSYSPIFGALGDPSHLDLRFARDPELEAMGGPFEEEAMVVYRARVQGVTVQWRFFGCACTFEVMTGLPSQIAGVEIEATRVEGMVDCTGIEPTIDGYAGAQVPEGTGPVVIDPFEFVWWDG